MELESARIHVLEVGKPDGQKWTHPLPRGIYLVARGDPRLEEGEYDSHLDTDAAYDRGTRARGLGWILRKGPALEVREAWLDNEGVGNNCAELSALLGGLRRAQIEGCHRLLVRTDSRLASHIITRVDEPRKPTVVDLAGKIGVLVESFEAVAVRWTPEKELKEVDRLSKSLLRSSREPRGSEVYQYSRRDKNWTPPPRDPVQSGLLGGRREEIP